MEPRWHDFATTGVPCSAGCLLLARPDGLRRRAWKYGVNLTDLVTLIQATAGLCMVCRGCHAAIVEHCHATGRVRGLVCRWCNNRISFLEGGLDHRHVVYPRGYGCPCLTLTADKHLAARGAVLETVTYRFLDHAMDTPGRDRRSAFAVLAVNPYPA